MEVQLRGVPGSGADKTYALSTQARGGRLGVLLQTTDGGPRYMLSDSVSGVDLAPDEFIGRVRPCVNTRQATGHCSALLPDLLRTASLLTPARGLLCFSPDI
jgi:hypothetical protein